VRYPVAAISLLSQTFSGRIAVVGLISDKAADLATNLLELKGVRNYDSGILERVKIIRS